LKVIPKERSGEARNHKPREQPVKAIAFASVITTLHLVERPGPSITAPDEVKFRVLRVGVCGMDCDEIKAGLDWKR